MTLSSELEKRHHFRFLRAIFRHFWFLVDLSRFACFINYYAENLRQIHGRCPTHLECICHPVVKSLIQLQILFLRVRSFFCLRVCLSKFEAPQTIFIAIFELSGVENPYKQ